MSTAQANLLERAGWFREAAECYESAISEEPSIDAFLDLALLYWQCTNLGFYAAHRLDDAFVRHAGLRLQAVLDAARDAFPRDDEIRFWARYIAWAEYGTSFSVEECEALRTTMSAMHIFAMTWGERGEDGVRALLERFEGQHTARARYVTSVIESGLAALEGSRKAARKSSGG